jgi:hypothetical protein
LIIPKKGFTCAKAITKIGRSHQRAIERQKECGGTKNVIAVFDIIKDR